MVRDLGRISALHFSIDRNLAAAALHYRDIESLENPKHDEVDYDGQRS